MGKPLSSLRYEFDFYPEVGEAIDFLPGMKWLRLPLPFMLGHINVWLLKEGDRWALVDTGIYTPMSRQAWEGIFSGELADSSLSRVLVTHMHPDHVGCAGWLCRRFDIDLYMPRDEYLLCRLLVTTGGAPAPHEGRKFYQSAGFSEENMFRYIEMFGSYGKVVSELPGEFRRLHEDSEVSIGEHSWQVITGHGHSPEHACLYCPELNVLISGDQILPTISPNVSVYPTEPAGNPLEGWFESLHRLKDRVPDDVLVLPAHGKPFRGVKPRLDALIEEHETGLENLRLLCREPKRAVDVFSSLFKSDINDGNLIMATGEAVAHLNFLIYADEMDFETDTDGTRWYRTL